jgi:hypothetical protein
MSVECSICERDVRAGCNCHQDGRVARDADVDRAVDIFHAEYRRVFPRGGDAQDHDEAVRAGIEALREWRCKGTGG